MCDINSSEVSTEQFSSSSSSSENESLSDSSECNNSSSSSSSSSNVTLIIDGENITGSSKLPSEAYPSHSTISLTEDIKRFMKNRKPHKQKYMRAILQLKFGKPDVLRLVHMVRPVLVKEEAVIRVEAAGINPVDTYIREGIYKNLPELPTVLGKEVAGTIVEIDEKAANNKYKLKAGDKVFARLISNGGYSEYVATRIENILPLLGNLTFSQGASIYVTYYTAYRALVLKADIDTTDSLFIHGASGGVGTAALQIAKHLGVAKIGATAGTEEGMKMLKELGADYVFNHRKKGHIHEAKSVMGGQGFNVVLENFADMYLGDDCNALASNGRIAVVGCRGSVEITPRSLMVTEGKVVGVNLGHFTPKELEECTKFILEGMETGWLKPVVGREYRLQEAQQAHDDMIYKSASHGKLVFRMTHEKINMSVNFMGSTASEGE